MMRRILTGVIAPALLLAACAAPLPPGAAPEPVRPDEAPPLGPIRPYTLPPTEEFTLANGMRVFLLRQSTLPLVTARVIVDAGALYEPAEKSGLALLTGSLLSEGTRQHTGAEIARRMEQLGAQFQTGASYGLASVTVTALRSNFPEALRLAASTVTEPSFPESEVTRLRTQAVASYRRAQATVEGLANEMFYRALFEPSAPYSRLPGGTAATLEQISRSDVVEWHRTMYSPAGTTLLFVGDLDTAAARRIAEEAFGGWRVSPAPRRPVQNPARQLPGTRVILVDRPGSVQSAILVGQAAIGTDHPDYIHFSALSHVLGGGFNSRINQNLRELHGWTYGAFTSFTPLRGAGTFAITSSVRTNATDSALVESVREYRRIATEAVPAPELAGALNNLVGSFPTSVQTVQGLAQRMQTVLLYDLPLDFWGSYRERLAAVGPGDVLAIAGRHLRPDAITIVVAGDLASVEAPIRALNLGTVEVWSSEGVPLR